MFRIISYLFLLSIVLSCNSSNDSSYDAYVPKVPSYDNSALWYTGNNNDSIDVFYITPTCIFDWKEESSGKTLHHYDVYGGVMKENFDYSLQLAREIFVCLVLIISEGSHSIRKLQLPMLKSLGDTSSNDGLKKKFSLSLRSSSVSPKMPPSGKNDHTPRCPPTPAYSHIM